MEATTEQTKKESELMQASRDAWNAAYDLANERRGIVEPVLRTSEFPENYRDTPRVGSCLG